MGFEPMTRRFGLMTETWMYILSGSLKDFVSAMRFKESNSLKQKHSVSLALVSGSRMQSRQNYAIDHYIGL